MTTFSVVIPCLNGARTLGRQLEAISSSSGPELIEILVADNGSTDGTASLIAEFHERDSRIQRVDASRARGINVARNRGSRAATGDFLLFVDADDWVSTEWFEAIQARVDDDVSLLGGGVERVDVDGEVIAVDVGGYQMLWDRPWPIGANCGVRRSVLIQLGMFDESFQGGGDETEFFWRASLAGYSLVTIPEAIVKYQLRTSARAVFKQHMAYGRSHVRLFVRFSEHGMPRPPVWRAAGAAAVGLLGCLSPRRTVRLKSAGRLGTYLGRAAESLRLRVFYV